MASLLQVLPTLRGAVASSTSSSELFVRCARGAKPAAQSALTRSPPSARAAVQRRGNFTVTNERLEAFLNAEVKYLAQRSVGQVKLEQIVYVTEPAEVAKLVHEEIPPRFARRMVHIEEIPEWEEVAELKKLHEIFHQSFRELRLADESDLAAFTEVIRRLRKRHKSVVPTISQAIHYMYENAILGERKLNEWVDTFMGSRISTEMLTSHYIACIEAHGKNPQGESWWGPILQAPASPNGIVDTRCDPAYVCQEVAESVQANFSTSSYPTEFSYVTKYLYFVVEELLTNAVRAVAENATSAEELESNLINVVVCADEKNVAIRIEDKGGGIQLERSESMESVWSYVFSRSERTPHQSLKSLEERPLSNSPLAGRGMGLPLSRLYVRYLGGSVELRNMPGIGLDTYLFLNRLDLTDASQESSLENSLFSSD